MCKVFQISHIVTNLYRSFRSVISVILAKDSVMLRLALRHHELEVINHIWPAPIFRLFVKLISTKPPYARSRELAIQLISCYSSWKTRDWSQATCQALCANTSVVFYSNKLLMKITVWPLESITQENIWQYYLVNKKTVMNRFCVLLQMCRYIANTVTHTTTNTTNKGVAEMTIHSQVMWSVKNM